MGTPSLLDYVTPAPTPTYMPGGDRLSAAISDIWEKRKNDRQLEIEAATQAAQQRNWEMGNQLRGGELAEASRHNRGTEAVAQGTLQRDLSKQQMDYISDVAKAYQSGNRKLGDALAQGSYLFGIAPQVMAAQVAGAQASGAQSAYTPDGYLRGAEPGSVVQPSEPSTGSAIPGGTRGPPAFTQADADQSNREKAAGAPPGNPYQAALPPADTAATPAGTSPLPQAAPGVTAQAPAVPAQPQPAQAELNTPQPPPPPQVAGDATAPPAPPQAAVPSGQVRRDDIYIQPKPPSQLGVSGPPPVVSYPPRGMSGLQQEAWMAQEAGAGSAAGALPATPWQNDLSKHPTVLEANPNWEGQLPAQFPGGQPPMVGTPETGPAGVDPATQRRWVQRGFAAPVLPNGAEMARDNAQYVRESLTPLLGYATTAEEILLARAAIEQGVAASATTSPEKAVADTRKEFMAALRLQHGDARTKMLSEAQGARRQEARDEHRTDQYLSLFVQGINRPAIQAEIDAFNQLQQVKLLLQGDPSSIDWETVKRLWLQVMKNKGASTDADAEAAGGEGSLSIAETIKNKLSRLISGRNPALVRAMQETAGQLELRMLGRNLGDYQARVESTKDAPNDYARERARGFVDQLYLPWTWYKELKAEEAAKARAAASGAPRTYKAPPMPPQQPSAQPSATPPEPMGPPSTDEPDLSDLPDVEVIPGPAAERRRREGRR